MGVKTRTRIGSADLVRVKRRGKNRSGLNTRPIDVDNISEEVLKKRKHFPFVDTERAVIFANDKRIDCKIPKSIYKMFEETCKDMGVSPSWVIGKYILEMVNFRIQLMSVEELEGLG